MSDDDVVEIISSPCLREPDYPQPAAPPADIEAFEALRSLPASALVELGLRRFGPNEDGQMLWLFPGEWYRHIPRGFEVVTIFGETKRFGPLSDDDIRFGCLAYGILEESK